jgi:hypothetical protein
MTPKPSPSPDRIRREERQWSHWETLSVSELSERRYDAERWRKASRCFAARALYSRRGSPTLSFKSASLTGREVRGGAGREDCGDGVGSVSVAIVRGGVGRRCTEGSRRWN